MRIFSSLGTDDLEANDLKLRYSASFNIITGEIHLGAKCHVRGFIDWNALPSSFSLARCIYYCPLNFPRHCCCQSLQKWNKFAEVLPALPVRRTGYLCSFCVKGALFLSLLCNHRSKDFIFNLSPCDVLCMKCFMTSCTLRSRLWWGHEDV